MAIARQVNPFGSMSRSNRNFGGFDVMQPKPIYDESLATNEKYISTIARIHSFLVPSIMTRNTIFHVNQLIINNISTN